MIKDKFDILLYIYASKRNVINLYLQFVTILMSWIISVNFQAGVIVFMNGLSIGIFRMEVAHHHVLTQNHVQWALPIAPHQILL